MTRAGKFAAIAAGALAAVGAGVAVAQGAAGPFTAAQAQTGRAVYQESCVGCHQPDLTGQGDALPLAGKGFLLGWAGRSTTELYKQMHDTMPYGVPGSLDTASYVNLVAYVLSQNGAQPGPTAMTATTAVRIGSVVGQAAATTTAAPAAPVAPATPAARPAPAARAEPLGQTLVGDIKGYSDVTDEMLRKPADADWLLYRGNYAGWSYSKLQQVNDKNVGQLQLAWSWALPPGSTLETSPIVHGGIMFMWGPGNVMLALKADTGELLWENRLGPASTRAFGAGADANRAIAVYKDKVYLATHEARLYALDARTGKTVWQSEIGDPSINFGQTTAGVTVINGKVISGLTGCGASGAPVSSTKTHCYISAYDAETGKRLWKFTTVALAGQPGGDTWNGLADDKRAGGETWILGTYDSDLNTMYWGTAQAKPWRRDLRGSGDGATDYTSSTVALNPDTGELKWHFNHAPGETFDLDEAFERILIDDGDRKVLVTSGKPGTLWKLDRQTGKFIQSQPMILNNVTKVDQKTGQVAFRKDVVDQKIEDWIASCPGPQGGHDWPAMSYNLASNIIVAPLSQSCVLMRGNGAQKYYFMPGTDGNQGRLSAFNASTFEPVWTFQQRSPFLSSVLSTAGNLAFVGDFDRQFRAVDVRTGNTLWRTRLGTTVQGHPITFSVGGKQYIAMTAGLGGGSPQQKPMSMLTEVNRPPQGNQIYVFALPEPMPGQR